MEKLHIVQIGDSVIVDPGAQDPDFGIDIGGWQGRVSDVALEEDLIRIDWDSETLRDIPSSFITQSEEQGFGWDQIYLESSVLKLTKARDSLEDVESAYCQLQAEHAWDFLGPEAAEVNYVLSGIDPDNERELLRAWDRRLQKVLNFPFEASIAEFQEGGLLRSGDKVTVKSITEIEALNGLFVKVQYGQCSYHVPLCDLEATNSESENYKCLRDYVIWFDNR